MNLRDLWSSLRTGELPPLDSAPAEVEVVLTADTTAFTRAMQECEGAARRLERRRRGDET